MRIKEQGVEMECMYCSVLYPEFKGKSCPVCDGKGIVFQPARMMDEFTSREEIFQDLFEFLRHRDEFKLDEKPDLPQKIKNSAINILKKVVIYNFNMKDALITLIHELDDKFNLKEH
ncbi:MAG: hypothetical protein ACTSVY_05170 [Candidatus Helarchaeota archaeon]